MLKPLFTSPRVGRSGLVLLSAIACATPALGHSASAAGASGGLWAGLAHPATGLDHVLAMVAVGLWAAQLGRRAMWALPVTFVAVMLGGAALGAGGVALPFVEAGIATSVLVLGLAIAASLRLPVAAGAAVAGVFAIFHGHAHGEELAAGVSAMPYFVGFVITTALLHLAGLALGRLMATRASAGVLRGAGAAIACAGAVLLAAG